VAVGPEKGPGSGGVDGTRGKLACKKPRRGVCTSTRPSEAVRESHLALSQVTSQRLGPVRCRKAPGRWGCNAASIMRKLAGARHDERRLGSFLHPLPWGGRCRAPFGGDGGTILIPWVNTGSTRHRGAPGGGCWSAWNRNGGARGAIRDVRGRYATGEGSSSRRNGDQARGVRTQGAARRRRAASSSAVLHGQMPCGEKGASEAYRPKRA
jgi:hypothetical protein